MVFGKGRCIARAWRSPLGTSGAAPIPSEEHVRSCRCRAYLPCPLLPQLPVPIAVFFLLYKERLVPCLKSSSPPLLSADELAMETRPVERDTLSAGSRTAQPDGGERGGSCTSFRAGGPKMGLPARSRGRCQGEAKPSDGVGRAAACKSPVSLCGFPWHDPPQRLHPVSRAGSPGSAGSRCLFPAVQLSPCLCGVQGSCSLCLLLKALVGGEFSPQSWLFTQHLKSFSLGHCAGLCP